MRENPNSYELVCNLDGKTSVQAQFYVGLSQYQAYPENTQTKYLQSLITSNKETYLHRVSNESIDFFDYKTAIEEWNISYIIIRNAATIPRLAKDSLFSLVFKNSEVAIFEVKHNSD